MTSNIDNTYQPAVYKVAGGNTLVVNSAGTVEIAGTLQVDSGAYVGLYGATPVVQPSSANEAAVGTILSSLTWNGSSVYPSAADATAIIGALTSLKTLVNQLRADLVAVGIIKGSA